MWALIPLLTSMALLAAFFWFRTWEEARGKRLFAAVREKADANVAAFYRQLVTGNIPKEYRAFLAAFLHNVTHAIVVLTVGALRAIERPLTRLSYKMRQQVPTGTKKEPSAFLKTITPEKPATPDSEKERDSV